VNVHVTINLKLRSLRNNIRYQGLENTNNQNLNCQSILLSTFSYHLNCIAKGDENDATLCSARNLKSINSGLKATVGEH